MTLIRLDKLIAEVKGITRKEARKIISRGVFSHRDPSEKVYPQDVLMGGVPISYQERIYIIQNKPQGVLSATTNPKTPTVLSLLPRELQNRDIFPAGRLDKDSTGLMLLTNDGQLAHNLLSPRKHVEKEYIVTLQLPMGADYGERFLEGFTLDGKKTLPALCERIDDYTARVILNQGIYHQIKRMFSALGNEVLTLHRVRIGSLCLTPDLVAGSFRYLTPEELAGLLALGGKPF